MAVLRTVFITLQVVEPNASTHTSSTVKAWAIRYQADIEMRTQEFARIKSRLERKHATNAAFRAIWAAAVGSNVQVPVDPVEFDPAKPWDGVYFKALNGSKAQAFWGKHVHKQALMLCTGVKVNLT